MSGDLHLLTGLVDGDTRRPTAALTYHGDQRGIDPRWSLGPNTLGEWLWPVTADYDPATDRTRVGLSYIRPPEEDP